MSQIEIDIEKMSVRESVKYIAEVMTEYGYNPETQIAGYILSEDPAYIPTYKRAREIVAMIDRDDLLREMIEMYINGDEE